MKAYVSQRAPRLVALLALAFASLSVSTLSAQNATVSTIPVGAITITIPASTNGTSYSVSQIAVPLLSAPLVPGTTTPVAPAGLLRGVTTSVTSNTITTSAAGWTAAQLAQTGFPMFMRVTSGANAGRTLLITGNTDTILTVDNQGTDLTTLGFTSTDTYEIVAGDTILGLFGTPAEGVVGGTSTQFSANQTDRISINVGSSTFNYYYNTTNSKWQRSGSTADQGNIVISPQAGIVYSRIGLTPLTITAVGGVAASQTKVSLARPSIAFVGRQFPSDTTLGSLGIENTPNWKQANANGVTVATSDRVIVKVGASILSYYYDATAGFWKRSGSGATQNGVAITADSAVRVQRSGTVGADLWTLAPNYTL